MRLPGLLVLLPALLGAAPAVAQPMAAPVPCADRAAIAHQLDAGYAEAPVSLGVQSNGHLLEVFSSPRTGTWSIVSTSPEGVACVVAAGEGWQSLVAGVPLTPL
jgi:hypothetical protein